MSAILNMTFVIKLAPDGTQTILASYNNFMEALEATSSDDFIKEHKKDGPYMLYYASVVGKLTVSSNDAGLDITSRMKGK